MELSIFILICGVILLIISNIINRKLVKKWKNNYEDLERAIPGKIDYVKERHYIDIQTQYTPRYNYDSLWNEYQEYKRINPEPQDFIVGDVVKIKSGDNLWSVTAIVDGEKVEISNYKIVGEVRSIIVDKILLRKVYK